MLRRVALATASMLTYRLGHNLKGETKGLSPQQLLLEVLSSPADGALLIFGLHQTLKRAILCESSEPLCS